MRETHLFSSSLNSWVTARFPHFGEKFFSSFDPHDSPPLLGSVLVLAPKMLSVTCLHSASASSSVRGSSSIIHWVLGSSGLGFFSGDAGDCVLQLSLSLRGGCSSPGYDSDRFRNLAWDPSCKLRVFDTIISHLRLSSISFI